MNAGQLSSPDAQLAPYDREAVRFQLGDTVLEQIGDGNKAQRTRIVAVNGDTCRTEAGFCYDRLTGGAHGRKGGYRGIHSVRYARKGMVLG